MLLNYFKARKQFSSGVVEGLNNKAKVTMRKSYGFRTFPILELALYQSLGKLPKPELTILLESRGRETIAPKRWRSQKARIGGKRPRLDRAWRRLLAPRVSCAGNRGTGPPNPWRGPGVKIQIEIL